MVAVDHNLLAQQYPIDLRGISTYKKRQEEFLLIKMSGITGEADMQVWSLVTGQQITALQLIDQRNVLSGMFGRPREFLLHY